MGTKGVSLERCIEFYRKTMPEGKFVENNMEYGIKYVYEKYL